MNNSIVKLSTLNEDIDFSPYIRTGMQFRSFFGPCGTLSLNLTDRILRSSESNQVFSFFDEIFANVIVEREENYRKIAHNYINLFFKRPKLNRIYSLRPIDLSFNSLGKSICGNFILGKTGLVEIVNG